MGENKEFTSKTDPLGLVASRHVNNSWMGPSGRVTGFKGDHFPGTAPQDVYTPDVGGLSPFCIVEHNLRY